MMLSTNAKENFDKEGEGEKREESLEGLGEPSHKRKGRQICPMDSTGPSKESITRSYSSKHMLQVFLL